MKWCRWFYFIVHLLHYWDSHFEFKISLTLLIILYFLELIFLNYLIIFNYLILAHLLYFNYWYSSIYSFPPFFSFSIFLLPFIHLYFMNFMKILVFEHYLKYFHISFRPLFKFFPNKIIYTIFYNFLIIIFNFIHFMKIFIKIKKFIEITFSSYYDFSLSKEVRGG